MEKKFKELDKKNHSTEVFSSTNKKWDIQNKTKFWIGGHFPTPNLSTGYHGILKQWWDFYVTKPDADVLLVSEGNGVKPAFNKVYPGWIIKTTDKHYELQSKPDIIADICTPNSLPDGVFDLVLNQATLEHVYDPWTAIRNCIRAVKEDGMLIVHTHPPGMQYHSYPRDYIRFMKDWWYDIPYYLDNVELVEFAMTKNEHVFAAYRKIK
tara:strand:- start:12 stop:638 length:627 start_codon:yes stop_codon:yes gene_type:complete